MLQSSAVFALEGGLDVGEVVGLDLRVATYCYLTRRGCQLIEAALKCGGIFMLDVLFQVS